jgi:nucleotide-binding universal stress UspA family protein
MTMFRKILLATDGSSHAERALAYARDLALRDEALVIVVHAFEAVPGYMGEPLKGELVERHVNKGREIAEQAATELEDADVRVDVEVLQGPPARAILQVAQAHQVELIVMGTRGHGDLTSLLLGSVSHRVLVHSPVPVMIVKAEREGSA